MSTNTEKRICVTGASGFLASHIVEQLLSRGYHVHGTVRDPTDPKKVAHLTSLPGASERLTLFKADLLDGHEVFEAAFKGTHGVIHVASPFHNKGGENELVVPAVTGTRNILVSVENVPEVKQIVLTSSMAAVGFNGGKLPPTHIYTEADWSNADLQRQNQSWYPLSKTLAEKSAWDYMATERKRDFRLIVINPTLIVGPILQPTLNTSSEIVASYLNGEKEVIPQSTMGYVDVRDVAEAHIKAYESESAEGRYIMIERSLPWADLCEILRKETKGKKYKIPTKEAEGNKPTPMLFDSSKVIKLLGHPLITVEESIRDTIKGLEQHKFVKEQA